MPEVSTHISLLMHIMNIDKHKLTLIISITELSYMSKKKNNCGPPYIKPVIEIIIPVLLLAGGIFLILFFTPVWVWAIVIGLGLVYSGFYMLKKWR